MGSLPEGSMRGLPSATRSQRRIKGWVLTACLMIAVGSLLAADDGVSSPSGKQAKRSQQTGSAHWRKTPGSARRVAWRRDAGTAQPSPVAQARLVETYGKLPLSFEANSGQTDAQVRFLSRGRGYTLFLIGDEAVLSLRPPSANSHQLSAVSRQAQRTADHGLRTVLQSCA
jgi:hypothetical protein